MYRLCHSDCEQLLELTADLYSCRLEEGWRSRLLKRLRALIPFEFGGCHLLQKGARFIAPCYEPIKPPMPAASKHFWRLVETHPMNRILFGQPDQSWKMTDVVSRTDFRKTELFDVLYRPLGVDCEMSAVVPSRSEPGHCLLITLHRSKTDFSQRDRTLLNLLLPHTARVQWMNDTADVWRQGPRSDVLPTGVFTRLIQRETGWGLTPRECEALFWVHQGKTNAEIGKILGISERTAETHILRAYPKMGAENRHSAMAILNRVFR